MFNECEIGIGGWCMFDRALGRRQVNNFVEACVWSASGVVVAGAFSAIERIEGAEADRLTFFRYYLIIR